MADNEKAKFTIGAFALIFNNDKRALLCHRKDYDLWNLPGGGVESGESPWEAVVREVKEETGFEAKIKRLAGIYSKPDKNEIVFSYVREIVGGSLTLNDEADQIIYFATDEIPRNTPPKQVERIKDAEQDALVFRTQIGKSSIELVKERKLWLLCPKDRKIVRAWFVRRI